MMRQLLPLIGLIAAAGATLAIRPRPRELAASDVMLDVAAFAGSKSCAGCHKQESQSFDETGHARALVSGTANTVLELFAGRSMSSDLNQSRPTIRRFDGRIWAELGGAARGESVTDDVPIDWCFGSGEFGMTFVTMLQDGFGRSRLLEHHWSWFRDGDVFALTPGHAPSPTATGVDRFGDVAETTLTRQCFACHTTAFKYEAGRLDLTSIVPGVQCERCHGPRKQHIAEKIQSTTALSAGSMAGRSAREQVFACGECHRRPEEINDEIRPDNPVIARFPSVGLLQSKCFRESESGGRLTCVTCHDPHRPGRFTQGQFNTRCNECHSRVANRNAVTCSANPNNESCIGCHMPKVRLHEHLEFTDHWIRRRI